MPSEIPIASLIQMAYTELYARQKSLIAVLENHGLVAREHFEAEVSSYLQSHANQLFREGERWWKSMVRARWAEDDE